MGATCAALHHDRVLPMIEVLTATFKTMRRMVQVAFLADTAAPNSGWVATMPSTGHCAIVAMLVQRTFGGEYVSASPGGVSHWFNRLHILDAYYDVDITGDQFGRPRVQVADAGTLYTGTIARLETHINEDTARRFELFASRLP